MSTPVSGTPLGGTFPESTPLSGISGADESKDLSAEIASILRGVDELAVTLGTTPVDEEKSGPILQAPHLSLNNALSIRYDTIAQLSLAIQESDKGDIDVLKSMFQQLLEFGKPGDLIRAIEEGIASGQSSAEIREFLDKLKAGTATLDQNNLTLLTNNFNQWLGAINTKERSNAARSLLLLLYLLPESNTPSADQSFTSSNAGGARSLSLTAGTQTMTGPAYFRELIRSLYQQVMQSLILSGGVQSIGSISSTLTTKNASEIEQAFVFLIKNASILSQQSAQSLLDAANNATLQNSQVLDVVKATSVLSTFLHLLRTESIKNAVDDFSTVLGIELNSPSLTNPEQVKTALARFLQQGLATTGLSALYEGLRGLFSKNHSAEEARNRILAINKRVTDLSNVLNGEKITESTLSDTLATFNKSINDSGRHDSLANALTQVLQQSLKEQDVASDTANKLATTLGKSLFSQDPVTALDIQRSISDTLAKQGVDPNKVTNSVLALTASVVTQHEVQTGLIQAGAATAASQIASQLSQELFGVSVVEGKVRESDSSIRPVIALSPSGALSKDQDTDISLGASLLKDQEFATMAVHRGSSIWHTDTTTRTTGDKNIGPAPNSVP